MADTKMNGFSLDNSDRTVKSKGEEVQAAAVNGDSHTELNGSCQLDTQTITSDTNSVDEALQATSEAEKDVPSHHSEHETPKEASECEKDGSSHNSIPNQEHSGEDSSSSSLTSIENEKDKFDDNGSEQKVIKQENKNENENSEGSADCKQVESITDVKACSGNATGITKLDNESVKKDDVKVSVDETNDKDITVETKSRSDTDSNVTRESENMKDDTNKEVEKTNTDSNVTRESENMKDNTNKEVEKTNTDSNVTRESENMKDDTNKEVDKIDVENDKKENDLNTKKELEKMEVDNEKDVEQKTQTGEVTSHGEPVKDKIDIDGDEFIITINEDNDSDKEDDSKNDKDDKQQIGHAVSNSLVPRPGSQNAPVKKSKNESAPEVNITVKVPVYDKPPPVQTSYVDVVKGQGAQAGTIRYLLPSGGVTSMNASPQLIPHIVTGGGHKLQTSSALAGQLNSKTLYSSLLSKTASEIRNAASLPQKAQTSTLVTAKSGSTSGTESTTTGKGKERDILLPVGSWEMLDIVKWEVASHKPDNTFWTGLCNVNKKAEVSSVTKFLFDLGSDIVKESAYRQITHVQQKKNDAGKLTDLEKENLDKMKKVVKELEEKLAHLSMKKQKCNGCDFTTESENVMGFHKEHPHMDPPLNPHGLMKCCYCDYKSKEATEYSFHMESEHNKTGRVYSKPAFYQCGLCYFEHNQKNKLTNHKWKCMKHFKPNQNQAPQHPDVNFCLKNTFYKFQIKKPAPTPAARPAAKPAPAVKHNHGTRKNVNVPSQNLHTIQPKAGNIPTAVTAKAPSINYIRTPVAYGSQVSIANFNKNFIPVANRMPNVLKVQTSSSSLPHQVPQTRPQFRPATQKPTVGQLLKSKQPDHPASKTPATQSNGFEVCEICGGYVKDKMSLRIHFFYAHKIDMPLTVFNRDQPPLICEICRNRYWTTQGLWKHKQAARHNTTQTKSVYVGSTCWICHQKQENLYSHLLKFHRLSTGECMAMKRCMFCGHLSNFRKELEIHMAAAHGVIIKADASTSQNQALATNYKSLPQKPTGPQTVVVGPGKAVVNTTTKTKGGQGLVRNNFCVFCSKQFSDNTQLTLHCLGAHATCSSCGMVVAKQADLSKHVCRMSATKTCGICGTKNLRSNFYLNHLVSHTKKCSVRLKRLNRDDIAKEIAKVKNGSKRFLNSSNVDDSKVTTIKKIKLDSNPEEPIVLDSDDEVADNRTDNADKRKHESDNKESEPSLKKKKVDEDQGSKDKLSSESKKVDAAESESNDKKEACVDKKTCSDDSEKFDEKESESNAEKEVCVNRKQCSDDSEKSIEKESESNVEKEACEDKKSEEINDSDKSEVENILKEENGVKAPESSENSEPVKSPQIGKESEKQDASKDNS